MGTRRLRHATAGALVTAILLAVAATGCGGSETGTSARPTVDVDRWSRAFCSAYEAWSTALVEASTSVGAGLAGTDDVAARAALVDLFADSSVATRDLVAALAEGEAPDVDGGPALVDRLTLVFEAYDAALAASSEAAEALPTDDPVAFRVQVDELRRAYGRDRAVVRTSLGALGDSTAGGALAASVAADCTSS